MEVFYDWNNSKCGSLHGNKIHDKDHNVVGYIDGSNILDDNHRLVGYENNGTIYNLYCEPVGFITPDYKVYDMYGRHAGHVNSTWLGVLGAAAFILLLSGSYGYGYYSYRYGYGWF